MCEPDALPRGGALAAAHLEVDEPAGAHPPHSQSPLPCAHITTDHLSLAQVRNLYRRILVVGRDYPTGLDAVRSKAKCEFQKRAQITDELELKRAVNYGRYMVKEMIGVIQLKKYRAIKKRYGEQ